MAIPGTARPPCWLPVMAVGVLALATLFQPSRLHATFPAGVVEGRIFDLEQRRPLEGATVTLGGDALPRSRSATTGPDGVYRFPGLPPGIYELSVVKAGYAQIEQTDIRLGSGRTVTLDYEVFTGFEDDVIITGSAPVLDVTSPVGASLFPRALITRLPLEPALDDLPAAAFGVAPVGPETDPISRRFRASVGGGAAAENLLRLDGLDVTSPADGGALLQLPANLVEEVRVVTGGPGAERAGPLGGLVDVVTRRGGPELHGRLAARASGSDLQAAPPPTAVEGRLRSTGLIDAALSLGGPAVAERLWLFAGLAYTRHREDVLTRSAEPFTTEAETRGWSGRLTWQLADAHLVEASTFGAPTDVADEPLRDAVGRLAQDGETGGDGWSVTYGGHMGPRLFLQAGGGGVEETLDTTPLADEPLYQDLTAGTRFAREVARDPGCLPATGTAGDTAGAIGRGVAFTPACVGGAARRRGEASREEARLSLDWLPRRQAGSSSGEASGGAASAGIEHALRLGASWRGADTVDDLRFPGGQSWLLEEGVARLLEIDGPLVRDSEVLAVFVEDRLRLGRHAVLRLGLRAEEVEAQLRPGTVLELDAADTLAPRLSLAWDIRGNGRSRLHLHWGRYVDPLPPVVQGQPFAGRPRTVSTFAYPADGSLPTAEAPGTLLERVRVGHRLAVTPGLEPTASTEGRVGLAVEPLPDVVVSFAASVRRLEEAVEDVTLDGGASWVVLNPGGTLSTHPVTGEPLPRPVSFPHPEREHRTLELRLDTGFGSGWQLHAGYVFAETEGNYTEPVPPVNGSALLPEPDTRFDLPGVVPAGEGSLVGDRRHQWRMYGSYRWKSGLTTGMLARFLSGETVSRLGGHPLLGRRTRFVGAPGAAGRLADLWSLDFHLQYPLRVGGATLDLVGDVFNLTDREAPVRTVEEWTFTSREATASPTEASTQPAFRTALEHQRPRTLRLGLRLSW